MIDEVAPEAAVKAICKLPERDQAYWYLGLAVASLITANRHSDDPAHWEFMRYLGAWLRRDYESTTPELRRVMEGYIRTYWR